jgi:ParB family chromosome partitioning protein
MATNKRTGLGRGIGSLIPTAPTTERPVDVFFPIGWHHDSCRGKQ